ncbi:hypothetical protein, partial [Micromonospora globispora]|uniref:hypothetical protein n=1 Tax=Micromonospora globispora TaxID=1450148 RepID=UPI001A9C8FDE
MVPRVARTLLRRLSSEAPAAGTRDATPAPDSTPVPLPPDEAAVGDPSWADDGPAGAHHDTGNWPPSSRTFFPLPQGSKYYLIIFLAGVLPMVFLAYPADLRLPRRRRPRLHRARRRLSRTRTALRDR